MTDWQDPISDRLRIGTRPLPVAAWSSLIARFPGAEPIPSGEGAGGERIPFSPRRRGLKADVPARGTPPRFASRTQLAALAAARRRHPRRRPLVCRRRGPPDNARSRRAGPAHRRLRCRRHAGADVESRNAVRRHRLGGEPPGGRGGVPSNRFPRGGKRVARLRARDGSRQSRPGGTRRRRLDGPGEGNRCRSEPPPGNARRGNPDDAGPTARQIAEWVPGLAQRP